MARPGRLELPTLCLEGRRSIQLSYGRAACWSYLSHLQTHRQLLLPTCSVKLCYSAEDFGGREWFGAQQRVNCFWGKA